MPAKRLAERLRQFIIFMNIEILNTSLKPLIANLLRLNIGEYLMTSDYDNLLLEHNFDSIWTSSKRKINRKRNVIFLGQEFSGDYENAFQLVLDQLFTTDKESFFSILEITLVEFIKWSKGKKDFTKVLECISKLEMPQTKYAQIQSLLIQNEKYIAQKKPEFKKERVNIDKNLCFILMPFNDKLNPIYEKIIKPVLTELKIKGLRADEIFISRPIIEDVWNNIRKSKFLIADLTERNANVFYELGLAHALNKEVILMCQNLDDVPFDLRHYRIIIYQDSISGADKLKSTLKDFIKEQESKK